MFSLPHPRIYEKPVLFDRGADVLEGSLAVSQHIPGAELLDCEPTGVTVFFELPDDFHNRDATGAGRDAFEVSLGSPVLQVEMPDLVPEMLKLLHGVLPRELEVACVEHQSEILRDGEKGVQSLGVGGEGTLMVIVLDKDLVAFRGYSGGESGYPLPGVVHFRLAETSFGDEAGYQHQSVVTIFVHEVYGLVFQLLLVRIGVINVSDHARVRETETVKSLELFRLCEHPDIGSLKADLFDLLRRFSEGYYLLTGDSMWSQKMEIFIVSGALRQEGIIMVTATNAARKEVLFMFFRFVGL